MPQCVTSGRPKTGPRRLPRPLLYWVVVGVSLAALVMAGCASSGKPPTATVSPQNVASPTVTPEISPELLRALEEIEDRVSEERGLFGVGQLDRSFIPRAELRELLVQLFAEENTDEELSIDSEVLIILGLLEEGQELKQLLLDQLSQQVVGLFDPKTGKLYVVAETQELEPLQAVIYAHEYTHALQQGQFDPQTLDESLEEDSEARAALSALVEGDATLLQVIYIQRHLSSRELRRLTEQAAPAGEDDAPFYLRESLIFPYREGLDFVLSLYQAGQWQAVDRAYETPPKSTEQIMHPEKYLSSEEPLEVHLPSLQDSLGSGWEEKRAGSMGEFDLKLFLQLHLPASEAATAAAGWGGDRFTFWKGPGGERLLVLLSQWDTEADAQEFFDAYLRSLQRRGVEPLVTAW